MAAEAPSRLPDPVIWAPRTLDKLITSPKEAIDIFDFEPVAAKNIPPAHFSYMTGGVNDDVTLRANREGFLKFQLRPRCLVDVSKVDMSPYRDHLSAGFLSDSGRPFPSSGGSVFSKCSAVAR